jgi:hypothetical protein
MTKDEYTKLITDISMGCRIGAFEIVCLRREIRQLKELFNQVIEVEDINIELLHCRHGYYMADEEGNVVPGDWVGEDDGPDHTLWVDPDDPDTPDYQA